MDHVSFKTVIDDYLNHFFSHRLAELRPVLADEDLEESLAYIQKFVLAGGKRIRPYVAYLSYLSAGGQARDELFQVLAAIELLHEFCLVHDDIMDEAATRHGVPSVHKRIEDQLTKGNRLGNLPDLAKSQAILAGDLLLAWSSELFYTAPLVVDNPESILIRQQLLEAVILGQMIDVDLTSRTTTDMRLITQKMYLKTATYSFAGPMKLGAALAGQQPDPDGWCEQVGLLLGLAYQIQDDLIDITADSKELDKPILGDLQARQPTYFTQYVFDNGTEDQVQELTRYFGGKLTAEQQPAVVALFEGSGAIAAGRRLIDDYLSQARELIDEFPLADEYRVLWDSLLDRIEGREN